MAYDIGPKIGIEGEQEFRNSIKNLTAQLKTMDTEMQAVTSAYDSNDKSQENLTQQNEILTKKIDVQKQKLQQLQTMLEKSAQLYGTTDTRTLQWQQTVNRATAELNQMERQLQNNQSALDSLGQETSENEQAETALRNSLQQLNTQLRTMDTEMQAVTSAYDSNDKSQENLTQQNEILTRKIETQKQKLQQLQAMLQRCTQEYGENDAQTMQWKQEVNRATAELNQMERQLQNNKDELEQQEKGVKDAKEAFSGFGETLKAGLALDTVRAGLSALSDGLKQITEESREFRKIMGSLEVSSQAAGYSAEETKQSYTELYGVLADNQTAATTTANLQALGLAQSDLNTLIDGTIGAWAKYGDSIPIDGLAEAINETVKTGTVTGGLADVLNWAGTSEDDFNNKLATTADSTERANLIMQELTNQGLTQAGQAWQENNKSLVEANQAMANYESTTAEIGEQVEPVFTSLKNGWTAVLQSISSAMAGIDFNAIAAGIKNAFQYFIDNVVPKIKEFGAYFISNIAPAISEFITNLASQLGPTLKDIGQFIATTLVPKILEFGNFIIDNQKTIVSALASIGAGLAAFKVASIIGGVVTAIKNFDLAAKAAAITQKALNLVMKANPFVLIASLIAGVVAAIVTFIATNEDAQRKIKEVWEKIKASVQLALDTVKQLISSAWAFINGETEGKMGLLQTYVNTVWEGIKTVISTALELIKGIVKTVMQVLSGDWEGAWNTIEETVSNIWNNIKDYVTTAATNMFSAISDTVGNIKDAIVDGLGKAVEYVKNLPAQFLQWGKDMIQGLIDGIKSMIGKVGEAISGVADKIKSFIHFSKPDEGPLSDFDTYMPDMGDMLASGIKAQRGKVSRAMTQLTEAMRPNLGETAADKRASGIVNGIIGGVTPLMSGNNQPITLQINLDGEVLARKTFGPLQSLTKQRGVSLGKY